jgi:hypothetical protein
LERFQKLDLSDNSFTSVPFTDSSRSTAQTELVDHDRVSAFQNLDVSDSSVGDVSVYTVGPVPARAGP